MALYRWDEKAGTVEIIYRVVGEGTNELTTWRSGERMTVVGPLGTGFELSMGTSDVLVLGRGIGTCSLTALAEAAVAEGHGVHAVVSGRSPGALLGGGFYRWIGARHLLEVSDQDGSSHPDALRMQLLEVLASVSIGQIFVCGSRRLLELAVDLAQIFNAEVQVSVEAHMACGIGYCHGCSSGAPGLQAEGPLVCTDGPVFSAFREVILA
jgi:dihydroorotate dehydrogenase electron transfer subunit